MKEKEDFIGRSPPCHDCVLINPPEGALTVRGFRTLIRSHYRRSVLQILNGSCTRNVCIKLLITDLKLK